MRAAAPALRCQQTCCTVFSHQKRSSHVFPTLSDNRRSQPSCSERIRWLFGARLMAAPEPVRSCHGRTTNSCPQESPVCFRAIYHQTQLLSCGKHHYFAKLSDDKAYFFSSLSFTEDFSCFVADFNPSNTHGLSVPDRRSQLQMESTAEGVTKTLQQH